MVEIKKGFNLDTPTWSELLWELNYSQFHKERMIVKQPGFFVTHHAYRIPRVTKVLEDLNLSSAHLFFNLFQNTPAFDSHKDKMDVWYWQVKGFTKWILHNGEQEWILKEGDLIHVPKEVYHQVIPLGVRAGISMGNELDLGLYEEL